MGEYSRSDLLLKEKLCTELEISYSDFVRSQKQRSVLARYLFAFFAKKIHRERTLQSIGSALKLHHATVLHAFDSIETHIEVKTKIDGVDVKELVGTLNAFVFSDIKTKPIVNVFGYATLNKRKALLV